MAQHVADVIAVIEQIEPRPVDLMGHSRGGHIAFRVAEQRPDLLRKVVLAEPGGDLDASLTPAAAVSGQPTLGVRVAASVKKVVSGDIEGALMNFVDVIDGDGAWARLPAASRQPLRDNIFTLLGQAGEKRRPFAKAEVESITTPTLLIGGGATPRSFCQLCGQLV